MTISTTGNSQVFPGNGATTVFSFTFVGGSAAWLSVVYTNASGVQTDVTSSCTIALNAATGGALWGVGGTITYNPSGTPIASGTLLTVTRTIPLTQLTAFANQNSVYNEVTEESFDTELMQIQQINSTLLSSLYGTSVTSLTIGTGSQTLTTQTNKGFAAGQFVNVVYTTTPTDYMTGIVTSYTASSGALVVYVLSVGGSGTFATWYVAVSGPTAQPTSISLTGDVTGSGTTSIATTIAANAVTSAKFRQSVARSIVGVTGNATANVADIQGTANQVLVINPAGNTLAFGAVNVASASAVTGQLNSASMPALTGDVTTPGGSLATTIAANAVTNAKAAQMAALTLKGNATAATANAADVAAGSGVTPWGIPTNQNIIQNGDFLVDQANEGASVTITTGGGNIRIPDRWFGNFVTSTSGAGNPTIQQQTPSSGAPPQFTKSILVTASGTPGTTVPAALNFRLRHVIEAPDIVDLGFGTAATNNLTFSLWMKSSIASATYGVGFNNNGSTRIYVANLSVPSANTWTQVSVTFPNDTTGSWGSSLGTVGMAVLIGLSGGSNFQGTAGQWNASGSLALTNSSSQTQFTNTASATLEITGIRLERGSTATPFWSEPAAAALQKLRRYYRKTFPPGTAPAQSAGVTGAISTKNPIALGDPSVWIPFEPLMYINPTVTTYNPSASNANWRDITAGADATVSVDPGSTKSVNGVLIATSGTVATLGDILAIHYTADSGI